MVFYPSAPNVKPMAKLLKIITASALALGFCVPAYAVDSSPSSTPSSYPSSSPSSTPSVTPSPTPTYVSPRFCSASRQLSNPNLAKPYVYAVNLDTGKPLVSIRGSATTPSASVMKLVTMAWASEILPSTYTVKTKVLVDPLEPGTLILQGNGDHTLSQLNGLSYSTYGTKAPDLQTLATQAVSLLAPTQPITKLVVDSTFFEGGGWNKRWWPGYRVSGDMSLITALQLDGDRKNPDLTDVNYSGKRSLNPVAKVAKLFKTQLGAIAAGAKIVFAKTPSQAVELTSVQSRTMVNWMRHALMVSDNTETEMIAFQAAKAAGKKANWSTTRRLTLNFFKKHQINTTGLKFYDTSGLSSDNRVTAKAVVGVVQAIYQDSKSVAPTNLASIKNLLPASGISGSLATRLTGELMGKVHAKVGFIPGLTSLAGFVDAKDGTQVGFAIFARGQSNPQTRPAIDTLVKRLYFCGANASN